MTIRIGTRGSQLAIRQSEIVADMLKNISGLDIQVELIIIKTKGDRLFDQPLEAIGGQGAFVKEIEHALLSGAIDAAVHSLKDMPVALPENLHICSIPKRSDPRDILISKGKIPFSQLPEGAKIGTGSLRRSFQLKQMRPDLVIVPIRGNIETRIAKTQDELDAVILAAAGIQRLALDHLVATYFSFDEIVPSPGQGALAIETRKDRKEITEIMQRINDSNSFDCALAERAFLQAIGVGCHAPVGAVAEIKDSQIAVTGFYGGERAIKNTLYGPVHKAAELGKTLGQKVQEEGRIW